MKLLHVKNLCIQTPKFIAFGAFFHGLPFFLHETRSTDRSVNPARAESLESPKSKESQKRGNLHLRDSWRLLKKCDFRHLFM